MATEPGSSKSALLSNSSFDAYNADSQTAILKATKLAVSLPADISFHRTVDDDFACAIDSCSTRTLNLTNTLIELSTKGYTSSSRVKGKRKLEVQEDVVDNFGSSVVDVLDQLFERIDMGLDEFLGRNKSNIKPSPTASSSMTKMSVTRSGRLEPSILHAAYLSKPQLNFKKKVDNSNTCYRGAKLKHKYNAQVPLGYSLCDSADEKEGADISAISSQRLHPYFYEIKHISYPRHIFEHRDPLSPPSFEATPFTWIDTKEGLELLLERLRRVQEIAVDLEHHSYRSFSGFLCLMQISTREEDFIVDTLALREELEELNEIFTDPKIVKILHGADSDVVWLQQDFNIYIVNLFDTYHASKILDFPRHGLGALLEMYCDFVPDKRYQLADWRIRPLPDEMLHYARADTHFLLYVYDNLRNALLDRARGEPHLVQTALDRSQETALRVYEPEVYDLHGGRGPGGWNTLAEKWGRALFGTPRVVFRAVHAWRDAIARTEDESTRYVLPNHYLFQLAERPPADMASLLAVFRPVPPLVRTKAASLLEVIRSAVKEALLSEGRGLENENANHVRAVVNDSQEVLLPQNRSHEASVHSKNTSKNAISPSFEVWTRKSCGLVAASSSLLNTRVDARTTRSALLPGDRASNESASNFTEGDRKRYEDVVSRIHGTLAVTPTVPRVPTTTTLSRVKREEFGTISSSDPVPTTGSTPETEQIEIPFVPESEQQSSLVIAKVEGDAIITVGRTRERKRKWSKQGETTDVQNKDIKKARGGVTDGHEVEAAEPKAEEFDYDAVPNLFDQPIRESIALNPRKGKPSKGHPTFGSGNFPAPPRAYNAVKGANVSYTFKR